MLLKPNRLVFNARISNPDVRRASGDGRQEWAKRGAAARLHSLGSRTVGLRPSSVFLFFLPQIFSVLSVPSVVHSSIFWEGE